jgi:hypothetical protein
VYGSTNIYPETVVNIFIFVKVKISKEKHVAILLPVRNQHWTVKHDRYGATGPYAFSGDQWVGYEDIESVKEKVHELTVNIRRCKFWYITNLEHCLLCCVCCAHIAHLRQECHNSEFGIFELLV